MPHFNFTLVLLASLICIGVHAVTRRDKLLGFVQLWIRDKNGDLKNRLFEPLFECVTCTASVWGTIVYLAFIGFEFERWGYVYWQWQLWEEIYNYLLFLLAVAGLNYLVSRMLALVQSMIDTNKNTVDNSIDQANALQHILEAMKEKGELWYCDEEDLPDKCSGIKETIPATQEEILSMCKESEIPRQ